MSKYINDPREMSINPEIGVTYEEDNRIETMYHWGAKVLDLCDMEVSEYMKPMTVIAESNPESGSSGTTKVNITMKVSVITPEGDILDKDGNVIGTTQGDGTWKVRWSWNGDFNGKLVSYVTVKDNDSNEYVITSNIENNQGKEQTSVITGIGENESITSIGNCTIGTSQSTATGSTVVILDEATKSEYEIKITPSSGDEPVVNTLIYYSFIPKSEEPLFDDMDTITILEAEGNGKEFKFYPEASPEYIAEAEKFDNFEPPYDGNNAGELWEEFVTEYENENRYVLRMYIPKEIENSYNYNLYNDNAGILVPAIFEKTGVEKSYNSIVYSEYINENDAYLYDDVNDREFTIKLIISEK